MKPLAGHVLQHTHEWDKARMTHPRTLGAGTLSSPELESLLTSESNPTAQVPPRSSSPNPALTRLIRLGSFGWSNRLVLVLLMGCPELSKRDIPTLEPRRNISVAPKEALFKIGVPSMAFALDKRRSALVVGLATRSSGSTTFALESLLKARYGGLTTTPPILALDSFRRALFCTLASVDPDAPLSDKLEPYSSSSPTEDGDPPPRLSPLYARFSRSMSSRALVLME